MGARPTSRGIPTLCRLEVGRARTSRRLRGPSGGGMRTAFPTAVRSGSPLTSWGGERLFSPSPSPHPFARVGVDHPEGNPLQLRPHLRDRRRGNHAPEPAPEGTLVSGARVVTVLSPTSPHPSLVCALTAAHSNRPEGAVGLRRLLRILSASSVRRSSLPSRASYPPSSPCTRLAP